MSEFEFELRQYVRKIGPRFILHVVASELKSEVEETKPDQRGQWAGEYLALSQILRNILNEEVECDQPGI